ncbi:MAG: type II toxin-antitoxin system HicA family toxin [Minisyncoccota bacterium]
MKRVDFILYLRQSGCRFVREGAKHSVFLNPSNDFMSTVPCHSEINPFLVRKICKDLGVSAPRSR